MSQLVLMGSGETAPSLVPLHRRLLSGLLTPRACWFDTPYGFQDNAEILSEKTVEFFLSNFSLPLSVVRFPNAGIAEAARQTAFSVAQGSNYLFSGPGSPSYALAQWKDTVFPPLFLSKLAPGEKSVVLFASATACTVGRYCLPVYEIYKVGQRPHWLEGLDLLGALGFNALVLPHFNNTVGGNHDTRFCYLGENRLRLLEQELDPETWIWGVDEHTALVLNFESSQFEVFGKGGVTLRRRGAVKFLASGTSGSLSQLRAPSDGEAEAPPVGPLTSPVEAATQGLITDLARRHEAEFEQALQARSGRDAALQLVALEQLLEEWSGDTDQHHRQLARARFRGMLERLGEAADEGLRDPVCVIAPWVESLLAIRAEARREGQFALADLVRGELRRHGVEVQDQAAGPSRWSLRMPDGCAR